MKRAFILLGMSAFCGVSLGQGVINFINYSPANNVNGQVTRSDYATLAGSEFLGQLYASAPGGSLQAVGVPVPFIANGIVSSAPDPVLVPGVFPGEFADVMLRSWLAADGTSWELACANGGEVVQSNVITIVLGGGILPPAFLSGLQPSVPSLEPICDIPEPSTWALMALGLGVLKLRQKAPRTMASRESGDRGA